MLEPTELRLYKSESDDRAVRPGRGLRAGRRATGCSSSWRRPSIPSSLDTSDLEDRRRRAEEAEQEADEDSEERRRAQRDRRRWEAFLKIAGGSAA